MINPARWLRLLEHLKRDHGLAKIMRTNNGPECRGEAFQQWSKDNGVDWKIAINPPQVHLLMCRLDRADDPIEDAVANDYPTRERTKVAQMPWRFCLNLGL